MLAARLNGATRIKLHHNTVDFFAHDLRIATTIADNLIAALVDNVPMPFRLVWVEWRGRLRNRIQYVGMVDRGLGGKRGAGGNCHPHTIAQFGRQSGDICQCAIFNLYKPN